MLKKLNELIIVKATSLLRYGQMVEKKKTLVWNFVILVMICVLRYPPPAYFTPKNDQSIWVQ